MKKLMLFLMMGIFMVGFSSAIEWDNKGEYDNESKTMKIDNVFGFGSTIAEITLETPLEYLVAPGYQKVAEFTIESTKEYQGALRSMEFFDLRQDNKEIERFFDYKIKQGQGWIDLNSKDIPEGEVTIGIFTEVKAGDKIEWIPTFYGVRIKEWAVWTASLNVGLVSYYQMNATTGDVIDFTGLNNGTNSGATRGEVGIINNSFDFERSNDELVNVTDSDSLDLTDEMSINLWVKTESNGGGILQKGDLVGDNGVYNILSTGGGNVTFRLNDGAGEITSNTTLANEEWNMVTVTYNKTLAEQKIYINGTLRGTTAFSTSITTNTEDLFIGAYFAPTNFHDGELDEIGIWNRTLSAEEIVQLYNEGDAITPPGTVFVALNSPADNNLTLVSNNTFNITLTLVSGILDNVSLVVNDTIVQTNTSLLEGEYIFQENLSLGNNSWSILACRVTGDCESSETRTINYTLFIENEFTFNVNSFETSVETYTINITTEDNTPTNGFLDYNGTNNSASIIGLGGDFIINSTIDVPLDPGNKTFFFHFDIAGETQTSTSNQQNITQILFDICNSTLTESYMNVSFRNETTNEELIEASLDSSWTGWLGTGGVRKPFSIVNSSQNLNYTICFSPEDKTVNTEVNLTYNNNVSQQRSFTSTPILTNSTTQLVLYLLPTSLGIFQQFQVRDIVGNPLEGVRGIITRVLGSSTITSSSGFTDSSGVLIFFLNPDITYGGVFSLLGFQDNTFSFFPTTDTRLVTMGGGVVVNGSNISIGLDYQITPQNSSLFNNTNFTFGFNVSGNTGVDFIAMNITNQVGEQLAFESTTGLGFISSVVNTSNHTRIIGIYEIRTSEENITLTKLWIIGNEPIGDYSIFKQGSLYLDYEFSDAIRLLLIIAILFLVVMFMSQTETADNNEAKVAAVIALIWAFSVIGWLDNPAVVSQTGIAIFAKQYGIAILSSIAGGFFFVRRIFV